MKILNNFDTQLKNTEYQEAVKRHWDYNVILIQRCIFYWLVKWVLPLFLYVIVILLLNYFVFDFVQDMSEWLFNVFKFIVWFGSIILFYYIYRIFIDYKMDFTIVTPEEIITYKQNWILRSIYKNLPAKKIRSTKSYTKGLLWNIFGYGSIKFITDGSAEVIEEWGKTKYGSGKLSLTYVRRPNRTRKAITELCNKEPWKTNYYAGEQGKEDILDIEMGDLWDDVGVVE